MRVQGRRDHAADETVIQLLVAGHELITRSFVDGILAEAARLVAAKLVAENYPQIVAKLDMQAIANLTIAEAAGAIRKTLHEKLPDRVMHVHHEGQRADSALASALVDAMLKERQP